VRVGGGVVCLAHDIQRDAEMMNDVRWTRLACVNAGSSELKKVLWPGQASGPRDRQELGGPWWRICKVTLKQASVKEGAMRNIEGMSWRRGCSVAMDSAVHTGRSQHCLTVVNVPHGIQKECSRDLGPFESHWHRRPYGCEDAQS